MSSAKSRASANPTSAGSPPNGAPAGDASAPPAATEPKPDRPGLWKRWRSRKKKDRPSLPEKPRPDTIEGQVADIYERFVSRTTAEVNGMWEMLGSRRRLVWLNFLAGLSRGVGFFLGVTLVGGLVIGGTALVLDTTAEVLGWKDVTFASLVQSMYGKFQEVRNVIDSMESGEPQPVVDVDDASLKAPTLQTPLEDAFPTMKYPFEFEDGPLPGRPPGLNGEPR